MKLSYLMVIYPNRCWSQGSQEQQTLSKHFSQEKTSSATSEIREWKSSIRPDFHSYILLATGAIFVSNKSNPKFLHLISENVVPGGHLPKKVLVEGYLGALRGKKRWLKIFSGRKCRQRQAKYIKWKFGLS